MKTLLYLDKISDLREEVKSYILSVKDLSRFGKNSIEEVNKLIDQLQEKDLHLSLDWDILISERDFQTQVSALKKIKLEKLQAIRVSDIGAYHYCLKNIDLDIHLNLESGNHNLKAIQKWIEVGGKKLKRVVLGLELPKNLLEKYIKEITVETEVQVLGKILLFYSPRSLLSHQLNFSEEMKNNQYYQALAHSEESPHRGYQVVENKHGTFLIHPKDHCLLDVVEELNELGINHARVDLRMLPELSSLPFNHSLETNYQLNELKELNPRPIIKGYYNVNRSDALFFKLKNSRLQRFDETYLGPIVDVKKDRYMALKILNKNIEITPGTVLELLSPDGKKKVHEVQRLRNLKLEDISSSRGESIILLPHLSGMSVKAKVSLAPST